MSKKTWRINLGDGYQIFVYRNTDDDRFAVVLVDRETGRNISRYDNSHGYVHQDLLDKDENLIRKIRYRNLKRDKVISYAVTDFKANWKNYLRSGGHEKNQLRKVV